MCSFARARFLHPVPAGEAVSLYQVPDTDVWPNFEALILQLLQQYEFYQSAECIPDTTVHRPSTNRLFLLQERKPSDALPYAELPAIE